MSGKYIITTDHWTNKDDSYIKVEVPQDPEITPWEDVRLVLDGKFLKIGNFLIALESVSYITYQED